MAHPPYQGARTLQVLGLCDRPLEKVSSSCCFGKGSRGGTWHVPRGTWRHMTNAIVVTALKRIEWCLSRPDASCSLHYLETIIAQTYKTKALETFLFR